jgi:hypothetical protein
LSDAAARRREGRKLCEVDGCTNLAVRWHIRRPYAKNSVNTPTAPAIQELMVSAQSERSRQSERERGRRLCTECRREWTNAAD